MPTSKKHEFYIILVLKFCPGSQLPTRHNLICWCEFFVSFVLVLQAILTPIFPIPFLKSFWVLILPHISLGKEYRMLSVKLSCQSFPRSCITNCFFSEIFSIWFINFLIQIKLCRYASSVTQLTGINFTSEEGETLKVILM